ncbi:MAG: aminotransferase [Rhizobiales bacterium]|nr:aminotransferase [Hyphomicrobiales bacterium]
MNPVFADLPVSVFETMSRLAREHDAVNLGQGFPDDPGPEDVRRKAAEAAVEGWNQYPPMLGLPELRRAISSHYQHWHGLPFDPDSEIMVTSGATEAIAGALLALINPGDEVVLFQPMYDCYLPLVRRAGGIPRLVPLQPPDWRLTEEVLEAAFTPKTRVVLFNNPLNPSCTVYARDDLERLARFCRDHDAVVVCDEVWEHVIFDGREHIPLIGLPSMRERCVKIGSAGKIFSLTGWKVGFVCASPPLMRVLAKAHQYITFTTPPNLQAAVAYGLGKADDYFTTMRRDFQRSRDRFATGLRSLGFPVLDSQGSYFLNVDLAPLGLNEDDESFCKRLVVEHGVAAIPVSAFYAQDHVRSVVRFCFAKRDNTLDTALERLAGALRRSAKSSSIKE